MSTILRESITDAPTRNGNRWRVIVARPGKGTSGTYSEELFRRDGHKIISKGGQAFINHDDSRNPKDMIGIYPEGSFWSEEDKAVVSELETFTHWTDFVNEVGPHCGMSLYALGEQDESGNITEIFEDRLNGCDLVARPGLVGSGLAEKLYESAKAQDSEETTTTAVEERKDDNMDEKVMEALAAIQTALASLVSERKSESDKDAQHEADAKAVEAAVAAYDAAVKAIDEAELLAPQVEALRARAIKGEEVAPLIEEAKAIRSAALEAAKTSDAPNGRVLGESAFKSTAWGSK